MRGMVLFVVMVLFAVAPSESLAQSEILSRALRLDNSGQQDAAIALYRQVLDRNPKSYEAHYGIARALDLKGNYAEAREHFTTAIPLAPDDGSRDQALRMLGVSWTFVGDLKQATPFFKRVFDRRVAAADYSGAADVANELGRVLLELGDPAGGFSWYRTGYQTSQRHPKLSEADRTLAQLRWVHAQSRIAVRRGNIPEAKRHLATVKALVEKDPTGDQRPQYAYLAGYVAYYTKDYRRAIAELQQADQQDPFILLLLAEAYEHTGDPARAREFYQKVLSSNSHAVNNAFARPVARRKLAGS
jgi:tetratricopeptide (TPR) repeat protein